MNFRKLILAATLVTLAGTWAGRVIYRAHRNLVSLDVENVPLRKVVSQLKRQTWENIEVNKDVDGMVTLHCENTPLDLVLQRIGEQVSARTRVLFPLYANSASKKHFIQFVTGTAPQTTGWTNYETAESNIMLARMKERAEARQAAGTEAPAQEGPSAGGPGPMDGPGMGVRGGLSTTTVMDLKLAVVPIATAAVEVAKQTQALIIPEDGVSGTVTVMSSSITVDQAADKMAEQLHRNTTRMYLLDKQRRPQMNEAAREQLTALVGERPTREQMEARREARANEPGAQDRVMERSIRMSMSTTPEQRAAQRSRFGRGLAGQGGPGGPGGPGERAPRTN